MNKSVQVTFQGNMVTLFSAQCHWKPLTIDIWQPERISWVWAGAGFNRHTPHTKQQSPPWCDYTFYSVIATSWSETHSGIKKCGRITMDYVWNCWGEGRSTEGSPIFSVDVGWMTTAGGTPYNRGLWLIHCVHLKGNGGMEYRSVFLKTLFERRINCYKIWGPHYLNMHHLKDRGWNKEMPWGWYSIFLWTYNSSEK